MRENRGRKLGSGVKAMQWNESAIARPRTPLVNPEFRPSGRG